jgi:Phage tail lysozyme
MLIYSALAIAGLVAGALASHGRAAGGSGDVAAHMASAGHSSGLGGEDAGQRQDRSPSSKSSKALRSARTRRAASHHGARGSHKTPARGSRSGPSKTARTPTAVRCSGSSGMLPENYATIVRFMIAHGYSRFAAAGIAGNIFQESKGNPESVGSGGGGLIGFTPLPAGYVTGNPAADLRRQLNAILTYNQQWSQYIPALNAAKSATRAADIYMNYFERPGIPAAYNRESAAAAVASACGF